MKLKTELVLLSLKMILTGFIAEYVKKCLLRLIFSDKKKRLYLMLILEQILWRARLSFENAEKTYIILFHHKKGLLLTQ